MSLDRERLLAVFRAAVADCDPAARVRAGLSDEEVAPLVARRRCGVAIGKAAIAMARGAGPVDRGVIIVPSRSDGDVPAGWRVIESAHPFVDERSVIAAKAAREVIDAAGEGDVVLALISGGTSALIEEPIEGISLDEFAAKTRAVMESGVAIAELNALRASLSRVKRGGLVATCKAPVVTLAVSDVIGDALLVIGSGPTIRAGENDRSIVVAPMISFSTAAVGSLVPEPWLEQVRAPLVGDVRACATRIVEHVGVSDARVHGTFVFWGEPTLRVPDDHGEGGRAQQLALELAKALRGTHLIAMAIGSDGIDGPPPKGRAAPAGAIVDGETWDSIVRAGHDPERALARCDAGTVLDAVGALVVTGPTGINHADLVVVGDRGES